MEIFKKSIELCLSECLLYGKIDIQMFNDSQIILLISLETTFGEYNQTKYTCPAYSTINLLFSILNIIWVVVTIVAIIAVQRRSQQLLKLYIYGVGGIIFLRVIETIYIIVAKSTMDECLTDGTQTNALMGGAIITILIFALFEFVGYRLLKILKGNLYD